MVETIAAGSFLLEIGYWLGLGSSKLGAKARHKKLLVTARKAPVSIPMLEKQLSKPTESASGVERKIAGKLAKGLRVIANTQAFELLVLSWIVRIRIDAWEAIRSKFGLSKPAQSNVRLIV